tara:strand:- start:377 stop:628 length:252 start_codon:yes stop_codon:yes gene_type:complete
MKKGEEVRVLVDYDLFDQNVKDEIGVYIKTSKVNGKHLTYFPINQEWAELTDEQIERIHPDYVTIENKRFVSLVKTMVVTYGA